MITIPSSGFSRKPRKYGTLDQINNLGATKEQMDEQKKKPWWYIRPLHLFIIGIFIPPFLLIWVIWLIWSIFKKTVRVAAKDPTLPKTNDRMPCPVCAEQIIRTAKVCRFCQAMITDKDKEQNESQISR